MNDGAIELVCDATSIQQIIVNIFFQKKNWFLGDTRKTIANYPDVSNEELVDAMRGVFPQKETDFMRLCNPSQLCIRDMLGLLKEDYMNYMSDHSIYHGTVIRPY